MPKPRFSITVRQTDFQSVYKVSRRLRHVGATWKALTYLIEVEDTARCVINRWCRHVAVREERWVVGTVVCHFDHCWLSVKQVWGISEVFQSMGSFRDYQKQFSLCFSPKSVTFVCWVRFVLEASLNTRIQISSAKVLFFCLFKISPFFNSLDSIFYSAEDTLTSLFLWENCNRRRELCC